MALKNFRITLFFLCVFLVLFSLSACDNDRTDEPDCQGSESEWLNKIAALLEHNKEKVTIEEGLAGTVVFTEGNCMPGAAESSCLRYPVVRMVHIHEYTHRTEAEHQGGGFHKNIQSQRIAKVQTDTEGFFEAALPPGNYSVFIEEEGMFYANLWNSEGYIQAATVNEGDTSNVTIHITHSAYY